MEKTQIGDPWRPRLRHAHLDTASGLETAFGVLTVGSHCQVPLASQTSICNRWAAPGVEWQRNMGSGHLWLERLVLFNRFGLFS